VSDPGHHPPLHYLRSLFAYDAWANQEVLTRMEPASAPDRAVTLAGHLVGADSLWLDRLQGRPQRMPVWPALSLDQCRSRDRDLARELAGFLSSLDGPGLAAACTYVNTKGEAWSSAVGDVLLHLLLHSAYHRGQIAMTVRAAGAEPAYTDYVHAVRQGFVASPFTDE
jgi:uncharacterized damage-inducible protein DinB